MCDKLNRKSHAEYINRCKEDEKWSVGKFSLYHCRNMFLIYMPEREQTKCIKRSFGNPDKQSHRNYAKTANNGAYRNVLCFVTGLIVQEIVVGIVKIPE